MKKLFPFIFLAILSVLIGACSPVSSKEPPASSLIAHDQNSINKVYPRFSASTEYPTEELIVSTERINLRERLLRFNQFTKIGYVTIAWPMGGPAAFYTIRGKVSNPDSQMTSTKQVEWWCPKYANSADASYAYCEYVLLDSPGDDGSWGPNEQGIFFFTTEDVLIETNFPWHYSDSPVKLAPNGMIIFDGSPKPSTVGEPLKVREDSAKRNNVVPPAQPTTAAPAATGGAKPSATPVTVKP